MDTPTYQQLLAEVDWTQLEHAYGTADDVAGYIKSIVAGTAVDEALEGLWSSLVHQSTVYSATLAAIPALVEIVIAEPIPDETRAELALLLAGMATALTFALPGHHEHYRSSWWRSKDDPVPSHDLAGGCAEAVQSRIGPMISRLEDSGPQSHRALVALAAAVAESLDDGALETVRRLQDDHDADLAMGSQLVIGLAIVDLGTVDRLLGELRADSDMNDLIDAWGDHLFEILIPEVVRTLVERSLSPLP